MGKFAQITDILTWYIVPVLLGLVVFWALWLGWRFIRTSGAEARTIAKKQFKNAFAILAIFSAIFCVMAGVNLALGPSSARANSNGPSVIPNPTNPGNYGTPGEIADGDGPGSGSSGGPIGTPWISEFTNPVEITNRYLSTQSMPDPGRLWVNENYNYNAKRSGQNGYMPAERITTSWGWRKVFVTGESGHTWDELDRGLACACAVTDSEHCVDHMYGENSYDMDIDTGEGEQLVINITRQGFRPNPVPVHWLQPLLGPPRINPNPMVGEEITVGRSAAMRIAGTVPQGVTSSWSPKIEVRAIADGTIVGFHAPETDSPNEHTWLVVEHDKPLPGQEKSYSFYGGLYASKRVTDLELIRQYNTQPFMSGSATMPLPPMLPQFGAGGFFYTSAWGKMTSWSKGHWQQGPMGNLAISPGMTAGLGIKRLIEPTGTMMSPFVPTLWFPTSVLNKNFNWYPKGQYESGKAADGGPIVGRHVKQGQFLAYAGGGYLDPGAGHVVRTQISDEGYNLYTHRHLDFGMYYEWGDKPAGVLSNFTKRDPWPRLGSYNPRWWYDVVAYEEENYEDKATWRWWKTAAENKHFENEQFFVPINYEGTPNGTVVSPGQPPPSNPPPRPWEPPPSEPPPPGSPPVVIPPGQTVIPPGAYPPGPVFPPTEPGPPRQPGFIFEAPQNITEIGAGAFEGTNLGDALECGVLHLCQFANLQRIGANAFANAKLKGVCFYEGPGKFPLKLETIGDGAFRDNGFGACNAGCHSEITNTTMDIIYNAPAPPPPPTDITDIPELQMIGNNAFRNNNIVAVNFNYVPNLAMLGDGAFRDNPITAINFGNSSIESIMNNAFRNTKISVLSLPASVKTIGSSAFRDSTLTTIGLKTGISHIEEIGSYAFSDNANLASVSKEIFEDTFCGPGYCIWTCTDPECQEALTTWAQYECPHQCPTCTRALEWLGEGVFQNTNIMSAANPITETHNGIVYLSPASTTPLWAIDIAASGLPSHVTFNAGGKKVGGMAEALFGGLKNVNRVTLPTNSEFRNISNRAFENCDNLVSVVIGNNIRKIGRDAFAGCSYIHLLDVPDSVIYIGSAAFDGWNWPQMIIIGQTELFTREEYAYEWSYGCRAEIVFGQSVDALLYHIGTTMDLVEFLHEEYPNLLVGFNTTALSNYLNSLFDRLYASSITYTTALVEYKLYLDMNNGYNDLILKIINEMENLGQRLF